MTATSILGFGLTVALAIGGCTGDGEGTTTDVANTTTTVSPTTTVDPMAAEEAAVSEAAEQARLSLIHALIHIEDPAAAAALDQWYVAGSPARSTADQSLQDLLDEGWRARLHATIPDSLAVESVMFTNGPPPTEAELIVCVVSAGVIFEPNAGPDGSEVIINDAVVSYRLRYLMMRQNDAWRLYSVAEIGSWEGVTECPVAAP